MKMPTGIDGAYRALSNAGVSGSVHDRLTTLAWLRILTDPSAPMIGGHDPRTILQPTTEWAELATFEPLPGSFTVLCARLNDVMGEGLLSMDWHELDHETLARAVKEIGRWKIPVGDPLGVLYQDIRSESSKSNLGAFYTPYSISLMMAMMVAPEPGKSVLDPCCGSGGMLLAALEAVRQTHGPDATLEIFGIDIDAAAVRLCKLNLVLAGFAPAGRIANDDALLPAMRALPEPPLELGQLPLFDGV